MERISKLDLTKSATLRLSHIRSAILMCSSRTDLEDRHPKIFCLAPFELSNHLSCEFVLSSRQAAPPERGRAGGVARFARGEVDGRLARAVPWRDIWPTSQ